MLMKRPPPASCRVPRFGLALDQGLEALGDLVLGDPLEALLGDGGDGGLDAAHRVGPARRRVLVGRLVETLDGELDGGGAVDVFLPPELDRRAGVAPAGARGVE